MDYIVRSTWKESFSSVLTNEINAVTIQKICIDFFRVSTGQINKRLYVFNPAHFPWWSEKLSQRQRTSIQIRCRHPRPFEADRGLWKGERLQVRKRIWGADIVALKPIDWGQSSSWIIWTKVCSISFHHDLISLWIPKDSSFYTNSHLHASNKAFFTFLNYQLVLSL